MTLEELAAEMRAGFAAVDTRFNNVEGRLDNLQVDVAALAPLPTHVELDDEPGEAQRQAELYADLIARLPAYDGPDYPVELRHPDLRRLSNAAMSLRAAVGVGPSTMYGIRPEDVISWWGGLVRADGGQGMYATAEQGEAWPYRVDDNGVGIGPG
jgi:hypothetical protein